ncbi:lysine--tRNA ligase [Anaerocolumna sp. MB42-C2]|uniref:lysine--tRNA ligase n=1 Tax=Anaerocolumna sp. MB42-C2 TaxID=3070997 RepID=UPI0027E04400|nr:lysine--tRNA ligase [Anaerocolumna sp. MB42-C2]WMJ90317.1 lysine--tRNA ligase [Anaerocolumna sp. MB42-C2]
MESTLETIRREKLDKITEITNPYPERFEVSHQLYELTDKPDGLTDIKTAGRITFIRKMGKLTFITIADIKGHIQAALKKDVVGEEQYDFFKKCFDIGDFIGVNGELFTTQTGEKTIRVKAFWFLGKALKPLPEKFHGLINTDSCYRQRYLDLIMNEDTRRRFLIKSDFIKAIRRFLEDNYYTEIETPVLINKPSGALARPFISHHNALDIDVYLRIAPETYLKRAIVGGFTRVFEFARCFRNEGMDATHLQDFTMLECYCAYYNYKDNMEFTQKMLCYAVEQVFGSSKLKIGDRQIDFLSKWPVVSFRKLILKDCGIDINDFKTAEELLSEITKKGLTLESETDIKLLGRGNLIDLLYKKVSRPNMVHPTFLTEHPIALSPLARANDNDPLITDRFQLVINGVEVINAYSELVDPREQSKRLREQADLNAKGDDDAMVMDKDYITAMEYGMPPISGWGMGIDRIIQVLLGTDNIKDSVLFPIMRPLDKD